MNINGISVGAYIFNLKERKMIVIRSKNHKQTYKLGIPKGTLNQDEHPWDGAMREIKEETGLNVVIRPDTPCISYIMFNKMRFFYIVMLDDTFNLSPIDTYEVQEAVWYTYEELLDQKRHCNSTIVDNRWSDEHRTHKTDQINGLIQYLLNPSFNYKDPCYNTLCGSLELVISKIEHIHLPLDLYSPPPLDDDDINEHGSGYTTACYISCKFVRNICPHYTPPSLVPKKPISILTFKTVVKGTCTNPSDFLPINLPWPRNLNAINKSEFDTTKLTFKSALLLHIDADDNLL